jgi:hypothetical protein
MNLEDLSENEWENMTPERLTELLQERFDEMNTHMLACSALYDQYVMHLRDFTKLWEPIRGPFILLQGQMPEKVQSMIETAERVRMTYIAAKE